MCHGLSVFLYCSDATTCTGRVSRTASQNSWWSRDLSAALGCRALSQFSSTHQPSSKKTKQKRPLLVKRIKRVWFMWFRGVDSESNRFPVIEFRVRAEEVRVCDGLTHCTWEAPSGDPRASQMQRESDSTLNRLACVKWIIRHGVWFGLQCFELFAYFYFLFADVSHCGGNPRPVATLCK